LIELTQSNLKALKPVYDGYFRGFFICRGSGVHLVAWLLISGPGGRFFAAGNVRIDDLPVPGPGPLIAAGIISMNLNQIQAGG